MVMPGDNLTISFVKSNCNECWFYCYPVKVVVGAGQVTEIV
jgi:hypothetical protein